MKKLSYLIFACCFSLTFTSCIKDSCQTEKLYTEYKPIYKTLDQLRATTINVSQKQMFARVADAFLYFSDNIYNSNNFKLSISRQELAEFTQMSKESISRIIKDFNNDQVIETNGRYINILNKDRLIYLKDTG